MDFTQVLTVFSVIAINLGTVIALYCQNDKKIDDYRRETSQILLAIQQEMKEFHGRLERQDAEFKGKMEKQDAEFKCHMMYYHDERSKK